jgi:catechol 2,3-dioxygenase-like lactoylglutathione lyase family enzyme
MTGLSAHHVGITVEDLETAIAFYRDVLGLSVLDRFEVAGEAFATGVDVDGASASFAHLDGDGTRIELVEYDPVGADDTGGAIDDTGAKHVAFDVEDLAAFYSELPESVTTLSTPQTTESGTTILFLRDPDDNLVEVLEP